jgi:nickel/cobalt transporter (NicO) family protein
MPRFRGAIGSFIIFIAASIGAAAAHPLGNFTVNHLDRITVADGRICVRYLLDLAEIPSFAVLRAIDPHATPTPARLTRWASETARALGPSLAIGIDGAARTPQLQRIAVTTRPGAAGLRTIYLRAEYAVPLAAGPHRITFRDNTQSGRIGWHDVVLGTEREPTDELRRYPSALLGSPRDRLARSFALASSGAIQALPDEGVASASAAPSLVRSDALAGLLTQAPGSLPTILMAALVAAALGALHALEPGHGKTLLAVTLVGARATPRQALTLAAALTAAHTSGVFALGVLVLGAAHWIVPETIYPWLTLASGVVVAILAAQAFARELRGSASRGAHAHAHHHHHHHHHHHDHVDHENAGAADEVHAHDALRGPAPITFRGALLAAVTGNIAPCPAALVVLLASIALDRLAYGLLLIVAFGLGLALVLTGLGIAVVRGAAWLAGRPRFASLIRFGPLVTSCIMAVIGAAIIAQGFALQGAAAPSPLVALLVLFAIGGYALSAGASALAPSPPTAVGGDPR